MHEEASTTSKISSSLVNISHNHLNAANITVAIVSTTPQPQALSVPSIAGSNSAPSLHELATCSSSSSVTQPYPVILPNQTTKIIINNNTQSKALDQTNMAIAAASNKANVIVSGVQSATSSEASAYQTTQLIIATSSAMPMNLDGPVLGSCKSTSIDGCEVTTLHSVPQPTISTLETATSIANSMTESSNGINNTANSSITDDFDITVQDLNNCSTDETEGYNESSSNSQFPNISLFPTGLSDQTDLKDLIEELCPVCGDKVSGYHYGLLTCESCKGFFKRTVQNKKVYTCVAERQCHIDKTQRKRCPFCRFQKCLEVGMKLEAVRADRMRGGRNKFGPMYKRDRARKLQIARQRQLALQALRGSMSGPEGSLSQLSPSSYQQSYSNMHIKQEIQIPQVSSLTSSPDSSPSPIAIALGQVSSQVTATTLASMCQGTPNNSSSTTAATLPTQLSESKVWMANSTTASPHSLSPKAFTFDASTNPSSTADTNNTSETLRVSPMIREFVQSVDDREWTTSLFSLLQSQSYNQCEVDLFELMCKVLDQNLFSQVDWARNTVFFKDLKVDDQMKLLQNSWSDMLVLDHLHQRIHNNLPDETVLHNGQKFDLLGLGLLGVPLLADKFAEIQNKLVELKFDVGDYICMKFLLLLNPGPNFADVRGITNRKTVLEGYENVQAALLDYTLTCYPSVTDKFAKLLSIIPEIHVMAARGEEHLYVKHCAGSAPSQTLLMEMLHAKRK